jgi:hypothetical protein
MAPDDLFADIKPEAKAGIIIFAYPEKAGEQF